MAESPAIVHRSDRGAPVQAGVAPALGALLAQELDSSPALIYLKDPDGRYVRVNRRYCEVMNVSAETLLGHVDLEVPAAATIDGPRLRRDGEETPEPLQLEYVVGAFADRPALSVMRFAVLDRAGVRAGTCGVAAPLHEAALAQAACAELMAVAERADVAGLAHAAAPVAAVPPDPGPVALVPAVDPARPSELELRRQLAEREYELAEVREALSAAHDELEASRDQNAALRESLAEAEERLESMQRSAAAELADSVREHGQAQAAQASEHERERAALAADLAGERDRAVRAEAALAQLQADAQRLTEALRSARDELEASRNQTTVLRDSLAQAEQRLESALLSSAAELSESVREHEQAELKLAKERVRADRAEADLARERDRAERAEAAVAEMRERAEVALGRESAPAHAPVTMIEPPEVEARPGSSGPRWSSAAQRAFAAALARSSDWNLTLRDAVKVLGAEGGWDAVCAWSPDPRVQRLRCTAMWTNPSRQLGKFETSTWQQLPSLGGTLLGRALGGEQLAWLGPDEAGDDRRVAAAREEGLIGGVLVPVKDGAMPVALLELLSHLTAAPSDDLSAALEATALQLAHLCHLARLGAEPRWAFGRF